MTFGISPGVYNQELDFSTTVPNLSSTTGAMAGIFAWGPVFDPIPVQSQSALQKLFGQPQGWNFGTWFTAFNFLEYGNNLYVVRTANVSTNTVNSALNAVAGVNPSSTDILNSVVLNNVDFQNKMAVAQFPSDVNYVAKYPSGLYGNSLRIGQCDSANQYHSNIALAGTISNGPSSGNGYTGAIVFVPGSNQATMTFTITLGSNVAAGNTYANTLIQSFGGGDVFKVNTGIRGNPYQYLQATAYANAVTNASVTTLTVSFATPFVGGSNVSVTTIERFWQYYRNVTPTSNWISTFQASTSNPTVADLMQVIVVDQDGEISGVPNTVLEVYNNLSRATDAVNSDGTSNYYQTVINGQSAWVWAVNDRTGAPSAPSANLVAVTSGTVPFDVSFSGGQDGDSETVAPLSTLINGWSMFQGVETITIDLVMQGIPTGSSATAGELGKTYYNFGLASWLISNIGQFRKDCVVFFSPDQGTVINNVGNESTDLINWASLLNNSTYAFMDSGYKLQYDQFNNVYRWIPLNGDMAGLCAYTDIVSYPWYSPAGFNRGQVANVTKLAYNPQEPDRDLIYPAAVNPVVSFPGKGTFLYGDKTFTTQSTGFSRINVRRLFLVIERAIKAAAQYTLFELNDVFTQNQFKNLVTPYLNTIEGANGIENFLVVCDQTINTPQVVDSNEFLCAIYIKPTHSINYIQITYINTPSGVSFSTIENVQL